MSNKLFVGNLSYNVTENDLQDLFAAHGTVTDVNLMLDRMSGRSRGFAFVTMSSKEEAEAAVPDEYLDESRILEIDRMADVPNCAVTSYRLDPAANTLVPDLVNFIAPLLREGAPVTVEPDAQSAPKP